MTQTNARFTVEQRKAILAEAGNTPVTQVCKSHNISATTFYKWKEKYGEPKKAERPKTSGWQLRKRDRDVESENVRLKNILLNILLERVEERAAR